MTRSGEEAAFTGQARRRTTGSTCWRHLLRVAPLFWKRGAQRLDGWSDDVLAGRILEFGANLEY